MHTNRLWLVFLIFCGLVVVGYTGFTLYKLYHFYRLQGETQTQSIQWTIKRESDEKYVLEASYTFLSQGKEYKGLTSFTDDFHRNSWSAEKTLQMWKKIPSQKVWYSLSNPNHSSLI